jgi:hypothetical protein
VGAAPDRQIGLAIADVIIALFPEQADETTGLVGGAEVEARRGGVDAVEQPEMISDSGDELVGAGRREMDRTAFGAGGFDPGENGLIIGQRGGIDADTSGEMILDGGLALNEPGEKRRDAAGVLSEIGEAGFVEQIGADQAVVEIDNERTGNGNGGGTDGAA